MPLSELQERVLAALADNRSSESHLAGAGAIHSARDSLRYSGDIDLFHDREAAVAASFAKDRQSLEQAGYTVEVMLSQPGFIRGLIRSADHGTVLLDWAHDSAWRFMPTVVVERLGHVLHPVDLAVNKVLALGGRDEPRDWIDILYLDQRFISLGALIWAAVGKDPGLNPRMLLDLLRRKGKIQQRDLDRLHLEGSVVLEQLHQQWKRSLDEADRFVQSRPASEAGRLYLSEKGFFFTPQPGEAYQLHAPEPGGVLPRLGSSTGSLFESPELRRQLERFFGRTIGDFG